MHCEGSLTPADTDVIRTVPQFKVLLQGLLVAKAQSVLHASCQAMHLVTKLH